MPNRTLLAILACLLPLIASAQSPSLKLPSFAHLQGKAIDSVDLTLGPLPLTLLRFCMDDDDEESAAVKRTLAGVRMIRVRSYEFASDYVYSREDLEKVRSQLRGRGWQRLVQVRDHKEDEQVDVFLAMAGDKPQGLAIIVSEPREFVIVHIVGTIEIEDVAGLRKHLGIDGKSLAHVHRRAR